MTYAQDITVGPVHVDSGNHLVDMGSAILLLAALCLAVVFVSRNK